MENLIFSLNATVPIFAMIVLGMLFKKLGWIDDEFADKANKFVFLVPLPLLVFEDLAVLNFKDAWNGKFVFFCFFVTLISIGISFLLSLKFKKKGNQAEFIQASYRSSAALLGMALIQNVYGNSAMGPLMIIGSVPLYNIMAVIVLSIFGENKVKITKDVLLKTIKGILTNPILIGIEIGLLWSLFQIPMPTVLEKTVNNLGKIASPLGLMAMGAQFNFDEAFKELKGACVCSFMKLFGWCTLFLPFAIQLGFRREQLIAILIMLGSATTISAYVMAKNMGHKGTLTSATVMITTLFSAFSITFWIYILKTMALL
ncbi:MAG: AEC family transporter [Bacillota bacterium]|nr:AEC family transporter [Bacillota bacterium]